ncbi:hypothetical protein KKF64_00800 [Patescibacteria group bacterium]|nr:hypothetical protein [Patescibacteria group bacterium]
MLLSIIHHILLTYPVWARNLLPKISAITLMAIILVLPNTALASGINASDLIKITNEKRIEAGLDALEPNHKLTQAAHNKAIDIITNHYFAHTTPQGKPFYEWIEENGYYYLYAGENLAIDFKTNEATIIAWMNSATHRANILNQNYNDIGLVALRGNWDNRETIIVVQMFGSLLTDAPTVLGQTLENLSIDLGIRKESLKTLASDLVMLPSLAGGAYFDILVRPDKETKLAASNSTKNSIAQSPITKIVQGNIYQTLLKSKEDCCFREATFALTEEKRGSLLTTPISYPSLESLLANIKVIKFASNPLPNNLYNNLLIAGLLSLLLLTAYNKELKQQLAQCKKIIKS